MLFKSEPIFCIDKMFLVILSEINSIKNILFSQKIGSDLITLSINGTAMFGE